MSNLKELNLNTNTVLSELLSNNDICKLLKYTNKSPLEKGVIENPREELLYKNIYPFRYIPGTQEEEKCFTTFTFRNIQPLDENIYFKISNIIFYIICHKNLQIIEDGLRVYSIMEEIDKTFNKSKLMGIGDLIFDGADEVILNDDYTGYYLSYKVCNFN